jgi:hypothetical protein
LKVYEEDQPRHFSIPEDKQALTLSAVQHYTMAEYILCHHHNYSDDDIEQFQTEVDHFIREWVELYGLAGLSN